MKKVNKPKIIAKSIRHDERQQLLIKSLILFMFLVSICLIQNFAFAEENVSEPSGDKPKLSEECKTLMGQMRELRQEMRAKREEIMASGEKPKLEMDENGEPIYPEGFLQIRDRRNSLRSLIKEANCPKQPRGIKGKKGRRKRHSEDAPADDAPAEDAPADDAL